MNLAEQIRQRREAKGLAKAELARRVGVSDVSVSYWESGAIKQIGHERLLALALALECTVSELLDDPLLWALKAHWKAEALENLGQANSRELIHPQIVMDMADELRRQAEEAHHG